MVDVALIMISYHSAPLLHQRLYLLNELNVVLILNHCICAMSVICTSFELLLEHIQSRYITNLPLEIFHWDC